MRVPDAVRKDLRERVSKLATSVGWMGLPAADRSRLYQEWTDDPKIGGVLSRFLNPGQIRTYIKDTLVKPYARAQLGASDGMLAAIDVDSGSVIRERYTRPPGVRLEDGRVICWGRAEDWKQLLMAVFERSFVRPNGKPHGAILLNAVGRYEQESFRTLVESASAKLGLARTVWRT